MNRKEQEGWMIRAASLSVYKHVSPQWDHMNPEDTPILTCVSVICPRPPQGQDKSDFKTLQMLQDLFCQDEATKINIFSIKPKTFIMKFVQIRHPNKQPELFSQHSKKNTVSFLVRVGSRPDIFWMSSWKTKAFIFSPFCSRSAQDVLWVWMARD